MSARGRFELDITGAFLAVALGMTAPAHRERYGYDLSWIRLSGRVIACSVCGDRAPLGAEESLVLIGVMCGAFIDNHARCGRTAALRRSA